MTGTGIGIQHECVFVVSHIVLPVKTKMVICDRPTLVEMIIAVGNAGDSYSPDALTYV